MATDRRAADLAAEARHAAERVALYQQRIYSGRADGRRLPELQRAAAGAADRAARARRKAEDDAPEPATG
jgi:hypothetical protein